MSDGDDKSRDWNASDVRDLDKWSVQLFDLIMTWKMHPQDVRAHMCRVIEGAALGGSAGMRERMAETTATLVEQGVVEAKGRRR